MKKTLLILTALFILCGMGSVYAQDVEPRGDNSHLEYVDVRYVFEGFEDDPEEMGRYSTNAVFASFSNSGDGEYGWKEARVGFVKELWNGLGFGAAVRQTLPDDPIPEETQLGIILSYFRTFNEGTTWLQLRNESYYGIDGGANAFRHIENHALFGHWFGIEESFLRFGFNARASYILDPNNEGTFPGGKWESETETVDGHIEGLLKINQSIFDLLAYYEYTDVSTDGESVSDFGVFPFEEHQKITRYGIGFRLWKYFKRNAMWFRLAGGPEDITDNGPLGNSNGTHVEATFGFIGGGK